MARFNAVMEAKTTNFIELCRLAGLNPETDLRFSDLSGTDLSDCDLRGFDLTGCDLTGATGVNVAWDSSTILERADIGGSIFEVSP
ncbi:hypothetical protein ASF69_04410 [Rhizobium sp. Leaf311]|nr:hypothetical protein ASF69_04410 [Rhizobium sp. Leaf311]